MTWKLITPTPSTNTNSLRSNNMPSMHLRRRSSKVRRYRKIKRWLDFLKINNNSLPCSPSSKISNTLYLSKEKRQPSPRKPPTTWISFRCFKCFKRARTNLDHKLKTRTFCNLNNLTSPIKAPIPTSRTCSLISKSSNPPLNTTPRQTTSISSWSGVTLLPWQSSQSWARFWVKGLPRAVI